MERDLAHGNLPRQARVPTSRGAKDRPGHASDVADLEALSAASDQFARSRHGSRNRKSRPSLILSIVVALAVGAALVFAGRFEHRCAATLRVTGATGPEVLESCRKELLDHAWSAIGDPADQGNPGKPAAWSVDAPEAELLRLSLIESDRQAGVRKVRTIAEGFISIMEAKAAKVRMTPTGAENALSDYAAELQDRLEDTQSQVEAAVAALPGNDPRKDRHGLLARWNTRRDRFKSERSKLAEASAGLARLKQEPEPNFGLVPSDERQAAMEADGALQQDLRELTVQLTELKVQLLNVWEESAGALKQLNLATDDLLATIARHQESAGQIRRRPGEKPLLADAQPYAESLAAFAGAWDKEFATLKQLEVDPLSSDLIDIHPRARTRLHDFLFNASKKLSSMRSALSDLSAGAADDARTHVLESDLMRGFRTVQSAHHRFEFSAGAIEPRDNYKLDAALQGSRGLRRRSQARIQAIDERLQAKAVEQARKERTRALAKAERAVNRLRESADLTVTDLVDLQEELNISAGLTEEFLQAVLRAEVASARMEITQNDLTKTENRLRELATQRAATAAGPTFELVSCGVIGRPANLNERLRLGAIAAALALIATYLAQSWIARRA